MEMLAWPRSSWTYFGCLPAMRSIVAQVWRRSWNLMGGSSALFKRGLKWRPRRLAPLVVVPVRVGKTRSLSCQRTGRESLFVLSGPVAPEGFCGLVGALYGAALAVLGLLEEMAGPGLGDSASYL
jgi:hypothetical protein